MCRRVVAAVVVAFALATPARASEPGQPLDWEDWVVLLPGIVAEPYLPYLESQECGSQAEPDFRCVGSIASNLDADSGVFYVSYTQVLGPSPVCYQNKRRYTIYRFGADGSPEPIAYVDDRCQGPSSTDVHDGLDGISIGFDAMTGTLVVRMTPMCREYDCHATRYSHGYSVLRLRGFTTLFEILQSYTPIGGPLSFRVPYMPSGLPSADYFDTYYGDLATVGDWSQARPLQCGYPATPPSVGDYLEVADTSPPLAAGSGRYYVTAVHHQGQVRFGRQSRGGVLSGRDSTTLSPCE